MDHLEQVISEIMPYNCKQTHGIMMLDMYCSKTCCTVTLLSRCLVCDTIDILRSIYESIQTISKSLGCLRTQSTDQELTCDISANAKGQPQPHARAPDLEYAGC